MPKGARERATYADLMNLPEHVVGELIDGELVVSPRPGPRHTLAASSLGGELLGPFQNGRGGPGGWWILDQPELHLGDQVVVPDLAGWRRSRLPILPEAAHFELPPDWVCEVLSPSTALLDRTRKLRVYREAEVAHLWFVDPIALTLEIYRLVRAEWVLTATHGGDAVVNAPPFEAIAISLSDLWAAVAG